MEVTQNKDNNVPKPIANQETVFMQGIASFLFSKSKTPPLRADMPIKINNKENHTTFRGIKNKNVKIITAPSTIFNQLRTGCLTLFINKKVICII